jgi:vacuolar-type H+-ATPase subunit B/Vma2
MKHEEITQMTIVVMGDDDKANNITDDLPYKMNFT